MSENIEKKVPNMSENIEKKAEELWRKYGQPSEYASWFDLPDVIKDFLRSHAKVVLHKQDGYH